MKGLLEVIKNNPVLVLGVVVSFLNIFVVMGFLEPSTNESIIAFAESLIILVGAVAVRAAVIPTRKLKERKHRRRNVA